MKLEAVDIEPDDLKIVASPDRFRKEISLEDTRLSMDMPISIKYDYLDLDKTSYNFKQEFHLADTQHYFEMMKIISSKTINGMEETAREYHFRRSNISGNLRREMLKAIPEAVKSNPIVYHFGLYTSENANRESDIRSPRIYFMLGTNGFIYPIFFDPYHEINP